MTLENHYRDIPRPNPMAIARQVVVGVPDHDAVTRQKLRARLAAQGVEIVVYVPGTAGGKPTALLELASPPPPEPFEALREDGFLRFWERNAVLHAAAVPDDPGYAEQWALPRVSGPGAWARAFGMTPSNVLVAIVDSGIQWAKDGASVWQPHPDLAASMAAGGPPPEEVQDLDGHGTFLAGTVAAVSNNALGIAALAWPAGAAIKILALRFFDLGLPLTAFGAAAAIDQAVALNADIINVSWDVGMPSTPLRDALDLTLQQGRLVVVAAGNDGTDNDLLPTWPASYGFANMISVMASTRRDDKASFSNYGLTSVDLAAPGVGILSTHFYLTTPAYRTYSGTSAACAFVTSAAALLKALNPGLTPPEIKAHLRASVDRFPDDLKCVARGRLNLESAISGPLQIAEPAANVSWNIGTNRDVTWTSAYATAACPTVGVFLSRNGGPFDVPLGGSLAADGVCTVLVPGPAVANARIRVVSDLAPSLFTESPVFKIIP
jgi:subtilisin family serine protease